MTISCGKDIIDVSKIVNVSIELIDDYELGELEEQYHGDYPGSINRLLRESRQIRRNVYSYTSEKRAKLRDSLQNVLNKYWYEIGMSLPHPSSDSHSRDRWTYAENKQSTFSVGTINENGDATVTWHFKADYGKDPTNYHVFGSHDSTLSLEKDIMPVLRSLSKKPATQPKSQIGEHISFSLLDLISTILDPTDFVCHDDRRATPIEMQEELKKLCEEYRSIYRSIKKKKISDDIRLKKREDFLEKYTGKSILIIDISGETKKYLEDYCDFNIFSKKQEIEQEISIYKLNQSKRISDAKLQICTSILSDFYEQNLLSSVSLSNAEKLKEYTAIIDFCCKYIPQLTLRDFRIESLINEYPDYLSAEACNKFKENWYRIYRSQNALNRGFIGEKKVYEVLRLYDDRIRILREYVWGHEHDFIVITPYGIFTIEVKNLRGNYVLTETGVLKCLSSNTVKPKDVAFQSKKHLETLRRNLSGCPAFSPDVPLTEIICSAESNFTIKNEYHYIPVCYYNTVDKVLFPKDKKVILSNKTIDIIEKYLLKNQQSAFKFDVFLPRGEIDSREEFINAFADIASGLLVAKNKE